MTLDPGLVYHKFFTPDLDLKKVQNYVEMNFRFVVEHCHHFVAVHGWWR